MKNPPPVSTGEMMTAKERVLATMLGLCAEEELEIANRLELLYWKGFAAGCQHMGAHIGPLLVCRINHGPDLDAEEDAK